MADRPLGHTLQARQTVGDNIALLTDRTPGRVSVATLRVLVDASHRTHQEVTTVFEIGPDWTDVDALCEHLAPYADRPAHHVAVLLHRVYQRG